MVGNLTKVTTGKLVMEPLTQEERVEICFISLLVRVIYRVSLSNMNLLGTMILVTSTVWTLESPISKEKRLFMVYFVFPKI